MKTSGRRTTTALLLAATMMLGSIVPPGERHAHAGGDQNHDHHHDRADHHDHGHHHAEHHHDNEAEPAGVKVGAVKPPTVHIHFSMWLLDLTLPVNDTAGDDNERVFVTKLIDDCLPITAGVPTPRWDVEGVWIEVSLASATNHSFVEVPPCAAALLCDSARHERSGVQLF